MQKNASKFVTHAAQMLSLDDSVNYYFDEKGSEYFFEFLDKSSLKIEIYDPKTYETSSLMKVINLLGQCRAKFSTYPVLGAKNQFEKFVIQVEDFDEIWDEEKNL